ncbi:E3 ubiquitin-protein ligase RNF13 [Vairimorpha necatrix]|uniref:E3 ubiquitin-protein ligase RNF13 n=1 Tax=Vairimorpha necatrix TaxID=6039 RepID=A0AAX4J984_9MICR
MDPFSIQQTNMFITKLINLVQNIFFTTINMCIVAIQIFFGIISLFFYNNSYDSSHIGLFIFVYTIINIITLMTLLTKILYYFNILRSTNTQYITLFLYELVCRLLKFKLVVFSQYFHIYEYNIIRENVIIYYVLILITLVDLISTLCLILSFLAYVMIFNVFMKVEDINQKFVTKEDINKYDACAICLEEYEEDECVYELSCQHRFHDKCISNWFKFNKICPTCKNNLWIQIEIYNEEKMKL